MARGGSVLKCLGRYARASAFAWPAGQDAAGQSQSRAKAEQGIIGRYGCPYDLLPTVLHHTGYDHEEVGSGRGPRLYGREHFGRAKTSTASLARAARAGRSKVQTTSSPAPLPAGRPGPELLRRYPRPRNGSHLVTCIQPLTLLPAAPALSKVVQTMDESTQASQVAPKSRESFSSPPRPARPPARPPYGRLCSADGRNDRMDRVASRSASQQQLRSLFFTARARSATATHGVSAPTFARTEAWESV